MSHEMITAQRRQLFHKQVREALKRIEGEMAESHSDSDSSSTNFSDVEGLEFDADANTSYLIEIIGEYRRTLAGLIMDLQLSVPQNVTAIGGPLVDLSLGGVNLNVPVSAKWIVSTGDTPGPVRLQMKSGSALGLVRLVAGSRMLWRKL